MEEIDSPEIFGYAMFKDGGECKVAYPLKHGKKVVGRSFHNGRFVMRMREKIGKLPG